MTKKQERVKYLAGIHSALSKPSICRVNDMGAEVFCFDRDKLDQVLATVKHLLKLDGITDGND